jgi:hypothetical protein
MCPFMHASNFEMYRGVHVAHTFWTEVVGHRQNSGRFSHEEAVHRILVSKRRISHDKNLCSCWDSDKIFNCTRIQGYGLGSADYAVFITVFYDQSIFS